MNYKSLKKTVTDRLRKELKLSYHNTDHVRDVIRAVGQIAEKEGIRGEELTLLKTAALLHDSGFLFSAEAHEERSCELAAEYLPLYGYSDAAIEKIKGMIMATKIPQQPKTLSEKILADADLDYLGRDDFFTVGNRLFREFLLSGVVKNEKEWNELQVKFLEGHSYFTEASQKNRNKKKAENLQEIKSKVSTK